MKKERESNFELLRILGMALIVTEHYGKNTPWGWNREAADYHFFNETMANVMTTCGKIGVDVFLMLTGYFLNGKPLKAASIARTWLHAAIWSYLIFFMANILTTVPHDQYRKALFPITGHLYWFVSAYIVVGFCTGMIATFAREATAAQIVAGLCSLFVVMSLVDWSLEVSFSNPLWFIFGISLGAFIRRFKKTFDQIRTHSLIVFLVFLIFFDWATVYSFTFNNSEFANKRKGASALAKENWSVLPLAFALVLFLLAGRISIQSNLINALSGLSLGVYLIHENMFVSLRMWENWVHGQTFANSSLLPIIAVFQIATVYLVCSALEYVRQLVFGAFEEKIARFVAYCADGVAEFINNTFSDEEEQPV